MIGIVIKTWLAGVIVGIAGRYHNHHALARAGEENAVGVDEVFLSFGVVDEYYRTLVQLSIHFSIKFTYNSMPISERHAVVFRLVMSSGFFNGL